MRLSGTTAFILIVVTYGSSIAERSTPSFLILRFRKTHWPLVRSHPSKGLPPIPNNTGSVNGEAVDASRSPVVSRHYHHWVQNVRNAESASKSARRPTLKSHGAAPPGTVFTRAASTDERRGQAADFKRQEGTIMTHLAADRSQIVLQQDDHQQEQPGRNRALPGIYLDDSSLGTYAMNTAPGKNQTSGDAVPKNIRPSSAHAVSFRNASVPAPRRVRRGSELSLLPDDYVDRQSHFSTSETCRTVDVSRVVQPSGCLPRRVVSSACQGTCHSRSVPEWHYDSQQLRYVTYCTCCRPHQMTYRRVRFACPRRSRKLFVLFIGVAAECGCRPCSDGDPEARQPYDYD